MPVFPGAPPPQLPPVDLSGGLNLPGNTIIPSQGGGTLEAGAVITLDAQTRVVQAEPTFPVLTGMAFPWPCPGACPDGFLACDGAAVSRTKYLNLFNKLVPLLGTCTITIAAPAVVTLADHGLQTGDIVLFTTTGTLPTGITASSVRYWVGKIDANTFNIATSRNNAHSGTWITTTGSQSGTHSCYACPWGLGDAVTTFTLPDWRTAAVMGLDGMFGAAPSGDIGTYSATWQLDGTLGNGGGNVSQTLSTAQTPVHNHATTESAHNHTQNAHAHNASHQIATATGGNVAIGSNAGIIDSNVAAPTTASVTSTNIAASTGLTINNTPAASAVLMMPPVVFANWMIKT